MGRAFSLIFFIFFGLPAQADTKDTFYVGIAEEDNPRVYPVSGKKYHPVLDAVLSAFALEEGIDVEFVPLEGRDFDNWFNENDIDFRFPDHPKWSAATSTLFYSQPLLALCETTRFLPQNQWMRMQDVTALGAMRHQPIAREWMEQELKGYTTITRFDNTTSMIDALLARKVDAIITDKDALNFAMKQHVNADQKLVMSSYIADKKGSLRISSEQYPAMLEKLDEFMKTHRGLIAQVARRHGIDNGRGCAAKRVLPQPD